jgi:crossover junction endodeoxyribonuclease RusA
VITFYVPGKPAPRGSKRHVGRGIMVDSSREVGPWRERVALAAHNAMAARDLLDGARGRPVGFCVAASQIRARHAV